MKQVESFFWGIIAALGALVVQFVLFSFYSMYTNPSGTFSFVRFFTIPAFIIAAACIEELFKYIVIVKRIDMFSLEKSYVVNALLVGLGFLAVELSLITLNGNHLPEKQVVIELAIIHMGTAGLMGYIVGTKNPKKISTFLTALVFAAAFHVSYNLLILERNLILNYAIFALLGMLTAINILNFLGISRRLAQR
jgi:hypothetical protein